MKKFPSGDEPIKKKLDGWYQHVDYEVLHMWRNMYNGLIVYHIVVRRDGKLDPIFDFVRIFTDGKFNRVEISIDGSTGG